MSPQLFDRLSSVADKLVMLVEGDVLPLLIALVLFVYVGAFAVAANAGTRNWGWRMAFLAFAAYVSVRLYRDGVTDAQILAAAAFRGLLGGGIVLGASWITFAILHFLFASPLRAFFAAFRRRAYNAQERRRRKEQAREQARRDREWERDAPQREAEARRLQEERERVLARQNDEHRRREDARFQCERYYDRHRGKLASRFPEARIEAYFERYLGDNQSVVEVERRSAELLTTLQELVAQEDETDPHRPRFRSIKQITEHFEEQLKFIEESNFDPEREQSIRAYLERDRDLAIRKLHEQ